VAEGGTDWVDWHRTYADPVSPLSRRLEIVRDRIARALDEHAQRPVRVVSVCSGDGRDLLGVLSGQPDAGRVSATLLEYDPALAAQARAGVEATGLSTVDVRTADAGDPTSYVGAGLADVVLLAGVFGNIPDADVQAIIERLPALCAARATVIWTRHRNPPASHLRSAAGSSAPAFEEVAFEAPDDVMFGVGVQRWTGPGGDGVLGDERLFTFFR
jgi:hypothetical protein